MNVIKFCIQKKNYYEADVRLKLIVVVTLHKLIVVISLYKLLTLVAPYNLMFVVFLYNLCLWRPCIS
jgi:hypothetical protein